MRSTKRLVLIAVAIGALVGTLSLVLASNPRTGPARGTATREAPANDPPRRIVSLIPAATEILFALGAGDRIVGRTRWDAHPPAARAIPDVGDGIRPSIEAVLARDPDLVILYQGSDNEGVAARLESLGVSTLALRHDTFEDLERNIVALGTMAGCPDSAERLTARIREELEAVAVRAAGRPRPRVYYDVWPDPPMTIGRGSYLDSLLRIAGGDNVFGDLPAPSPTVSLEAIVQRDPDLILYPVSSDAPVVSPPRERPGWQHVSAVAGGRVRRFDGDLVSRLGPRIGDAARTLARVIAGGGTPRGPNAPRPETEALACPG